MWRLQCVHETESCVASFNFKCLCVRLRPVAARRRSGVRRGVCKHSAHSQTPRGTLYKVIITLLIIETDPLGSKGGCSYECVTGKQVLGAAGVKIRSLF